MNKFPSAAALEAPTHFDPRYCFIKSLQLQEHHTYRIAARMWLVRPCICNSIRLIYSTYNIKIHQQWAPYQIQDWVLYFQSTTILGYSPTTSVKQVLTKQIHWTRDRGILRRGFRSLLVHVGVVPKKTKIIALLCFGLSLKDLTLRRPQQPHILMANTTTLCLTISRWLLHKGREDSWTQLYQVEETSWMEKDLKPWVKEWQLCYHLKM